MKSLVVIATLSVLGCSTPHEPKGKADVADLTNDGGPRPSELFRLRAECANQARQFEMDWRKQLGGNYVFSVFHNHYNEADGRCYVHISSGNDFGHHETVMDATEGIGGPELAWRKVLTDKSPVEPGQRNPNSEHDDAKTLAKIGRLMGDVADNDAAGIRGAIPKKSVDTRPPLSSFERK